MAEVMRMPSNEEWKLEGATWRLGGESGWSNILRAAIRPSKRSKSVLPLSCLSPFAHPFFFLLFGMRLKLEAVEDRSQWGSEWV